MTDKVAIVADKKPQVVVDWSIRAALIRKGQIVPQDALEVELAKEAEK